MTLWFALYVCVNSAFYSAGPGLESELFLLRHFFFVFPIFPGKKML